MIVRKCVIALSVAALMAVSVNQSKALPADPVVVAGGTTFGAGAWVAGGFIGVVAVLCAYDLVLKFQGVKSWDGTPMVAKPVHHHH
jgi:hypothetical protein